MQIENRLFLRLVLSFLVAMSMVTGYGQTSSSDFNTRLKIAKRISDTNQAKAIHFLRNELRDKNISLSNRSKIFVQISDIELHSGNFRESLQNCLIGLQEAEFAKDYIQVGNANRQMALIYKELDLFLKAAHYFQNAEIAYKKGGDFKAAREANMYQAHVFTDYGKEKGNNYYLYLAEKKYTALMKEAELKNDESFLVVSYNNLSNLFLVKYSLDSNIRWIKASNVYAKNSIHLTAIQKDTLSLGVSYSNYAESFGLMHKVDSARYYFEKANSIFLKMNGMHYYYYNACTLLKLLLDDNKLKEAEVLLDQFLEQINKHHERLRLSDYYKLKAALYAKQGNFKAAYEMHLKYSKVMETRRDFAANRELVRLQFLYDTDKKDKEIEILNKNERLRNVNIQNEKWIRNLLIFGLGLLVFILIFVFYRYREKNELNKTITQKNNELQRLSIVASNTSNAITVTDKSCTTLWVNDGFLKLYGWSSMDEVFVHLGANYLDYCGLTRAEINQYIEEIKESRKSVVFQAFKARKDGEQKFIQTTLTPVFLENGELDQMVFIDTDITELLEAREIAIREKRKAENALKTQELFLANVSHEIRTPMNGIIGLTRQLNEELNSPIHKDITESIHISAESLLHVVNDLLDVSKIRAGKMSIEKTSFSLLQLIDNFKKSIEYRVNEKGLKFKIQLDPEMINLVYGDPIRLNQVLLNLVGNAIKFTMEGQVTVRIQVVQKTGDSQELSFEIQDTGIGIPSSKLDTVFDHFTQLEDHRTRTSSGTGLGLGISKSLVEAMGGTLTLSSKEGSGTTVRFKLTFEIDHKQTTVFEKAHEIVLHKDLTGLKVLLVEDNSINQKVIIHDLRKWNCDIDVVDDAFEAIERLKNEMYDIILMDYYMPRMDGIETTRYIRTKFPEPVCSIPIIAITASAMRGDNDKFIQAGMNDYISKPFNPEKLYHLLLKWGYHKEPEVIASSKKEAAKEAQLSSLVDLTLLHEKAEGDSEYLREMFEAFLEMIPVYKDELLQHFGALNDVELRKSAHQLLSPSKLFGLHDTVPLLISLQKNVDLKESEKSELVNLVAVQLDEACRFISDELAKLN